MADYIQMTPDELRTGASNLDTLKTTMMDILQQMKGTVDDVCASWDGAAEEQFVVSFEEIYNQLYSALPEAVEGIEQMLNTAADSLESADEEIASAMNV